MQVLHSTKHRITIQMNRWLTKEKKFKGLGELKLKI